MTPYDVMLSESQERMLMLVRPGYEDTVRAVFDKWDLTSSVIGAVTDDATVRIHDAGETSADVPVEHLVDAPRYRLSGSLSAETEAAQRVDLSALPLPDTTPSEALLRLLGSANIASRSGVYRQYDQQVQANTVVAPGRGDAAVLVLRESHGGPATRRGIAAATDGNSRMTWLDPFVGGQLAVAEACRNVACVGAEPIALTDCLNFGNPERPEVYYQLEECIKGMADACRALGVPVVSGNVSLYNEGEQQAIYPTPVVGALGLLDDVSRHCGAGFRNEGDVILLLGAASLDGDAATLAGSEALEALHGMVAGRPALDMDLEARVQRLCRDAVRRGLLSSAHDCSDGGLAVALAESCVIGGVGATVTAQPGGRWDAALFGEAPSRVVVSLDRSMTAPLRRLANRLGVPVLRLGRVGGDRLRIGRLVNVRLEDASRGVGAGAAGRCCGGRGRDHGLATSQHRHVGRGGLWQQANNPRIIGNLDLSAERRKARPDVEVQRAGMVEGARL